MGYRRLRQIPPGHRVVAADPAPDHDPEGGRIALWSTVLPAGEVFRTTVSFAPMGDAGAPGTGT